MKKLLSALLIATLLIASVACVFAVAEEGDTDPIATIELHSGAIYESGRSVVLARIGENKTVAELTGYLRNGDAKDLNYFYAYVVVDGVVVEENETTGRPDGVKSDLEVPEGGYIVFISVTDDTAPLNEKINVGTVVTLEGTTIEALSALEPEQDLVGAKAIFTEPTEEDNTSSEDEATSSEDEATSSEDEAASSEDEATSSEAPAESSSEAPAESSSEAPETGDAGLIVFAILAVVALAGGIVVVRARG